ncbi:helix-turn-helix domain-containing protein [Neisseriaceae bacterium TC5R-5]|nr:helix-turn-helix domain-containing protein [Neisseriaceae bacterium TC5R-5]
MNTSSRIILKQVVAAYGGQVAFARAMTALLRESGVNGIISQQRISMWIKGRNIDPALCQFIIALAERANIVCSFADLHSDAEWIWPISDQL